MAGVLNYLHSLKPMPRRRPEDIGHLPSLDGLRALSIFLVLLGHLDGTRNFPHLNTARYFGDLGHLGVVVFFVISGFLITSLLLSEHSRHGRVSLKLFYARRALRIFPASYAFMGTVLLLAAAGYIAISAGDIIHAVTYTVNYSPHRSWYIGHLWSLSVEEQFYLLWPFAFVVLGPARSRWAVLAVILLAPGARGAARILLAGTAYRDLEMFPMVADSLAVGCLLATNRQWLESQKHYLRLFNRGWSALLLVAVILMNRLQGYTLGNMFGMAVINVALAVLIHRSVYRWQGVAGRVLNWRLIAFFGVLSYSLYLWQQLFLNRASTAWTAAFPENLMLAAAAALCSYLLLEKPLMKLRHRLRREAASPAAVSIAGQ